MAGIPAFGPRRPLLHLLAEGMAPFKSLSWANAARCTDIMGDREIDAFLAWKLRGIHAQALSLGASAQDPDTQKNAFEEICHRLG